MAGFQCVKHTTSEQLQLQITHTAFWTLCNLFQELMFLIIKYITTWQANS